MGKNRSKSGKIRDSVSQIASDPKLIQVNSLFNELSQKYGKSPADIFNLLQQEVLVPVSAFIPELSPLEAFVKYLHENLAMDYAEIGRISGRDRKTIWQAYNNSQKSYPSRFENLDSKYNIPVSIFNSDLSILESIAVYLKDNSGLSFHEIGGLLHRDERTIWTVYSRAKKKHDKTETHQ
ncbi:MAG: hypothetical protein WC471_06005 [Candidatus Woesearchaeota archaeon]